MKLGANSLCLRYYSLMEIAIQSIGTKAPGIKRAQTDLAEFMISTFQLDPHEARRIRAIYRATGIQYRHSVIEDYQESDPNTHQFFNFKSNTLPSTKTRMELYQLHALPLAISAIENCLINIPENILNITHVITVSCTGMYAPGLDIEIVHKLGLASSVERLAINFMGCYGVFNALKAARAFCIANPEAQVLIVSVELCSLHVQEMSEVDDIISGAIFSDGAGAMLVSAKSMIKSMNSQIQNKSLVLEKFYCDLLPKGNRDMAWAIADQGFDIVLSSYVPQLIEQGIGEFLEDLLKTQELTLKDIGHFAIHPGGMKILEACEKTLGITKQHNALSYQVLSQYGNMSSATIVFVLKALMDQLSENDHYKKVLGCAFGPGITLESMLLSVRSHC